MTCCLLVCFQDYSSYWFPPSGSWFYHEIPSLSLAWLHTLSLTLTYIKERIPMSVFWNFSGQFLLFSCCCLLWVWNQLTSFMAPLPSNTTPKETVCAHTHCTWALPSIHGNLAPLFKDCTPRGSGDCQAEEPPCHQCEQIITSHSHAGFCKLRSLLTSGVFLC